jgi:hypothetical protein
MKRRIPELILDWKTRIVPRISSRPLYFFRVVFTILTTSSWDDMSARKASGRVLYFWLISEAATSASFSSLPTMTTFDPCAENSSAIARPFPLVEPVTMVILPQRSLRFTLLVSSSDFLALSWRLSACFSLIPFRTLQQSRPWTTGLNG